MIGAGSWKGGGRDVLPLLESWSTLNTAHVQEEGGQRRNSSTLGSHRPNVILKELGTDGRGGDGRDGKWHIPDKREGRCGKCHTEEPETTAEGDTGAGCDPRKVLGRENTCGQRNTDNYRAWREQRVEQTRLC